MNPFRSLFAILGLLCIVLFYVYQNPDFLGLALIFFALGLVLMGIFKRPKKQDAGRTTK